MKSTIVAAFICAVAVAPVLAQNPMREGRWEITSQMQMPNMPMQMPAMKNIQCITQKDLEGPGGGLPSGSPNAQAKNDACKVSDRTVSGNKVTWKVVCAPPPSMTGTGEVVFNGDTYEGTMKMTSDKGEMTMKYSGKRLGDCTP